MALDEGTAKAASKDYLCIDGEASRGLFRTPRVGVHLSFFRGRTTAYGYSPLSGIESTTAAVTLTNTPCLITPRRKETRRDRDIDRNDPSNRFKYRSRSCTAAAGASAAGLLNPAFSLLAFNKYANERVRFIHVTWLEFSHVNADQASNQSRAFSSPKVLRTGMPPGLILRRVRG